MTRMVWLQLVLLVAWSCAARTEIGRDCTANAECAGVCINGRCADTSSSGGPCDEPNDCEPSNTCDNGTCVLCSSFCDDANPCTDDSCDADGTCQWQDNAAPCDDDDACTTPDRCSAGVCIGGPFDDVGCAGTTLSIYRSVGAEAPLASAGGPLTVNGTTAVFDTALPLNVGVGDVLVYDSDGDTVLDALAFIHRRNDASLFSVRDADGRTPTPASNTGVWELFRAYTSLAAAVNTLVTATPDCQPCSSFLGGTENPQIANDFDPFPGGKDLVAANQQWNVACYTDLVDDEMVHISDPWNTDATHFLKIFTPVTPEEVGVGQRHDGTWGTGYRRTNALLNWDRDVWIDGLSIRQDRVLHSGIDTMWYWRVYISYVGSRTSEIRISNSLGWMNAPASSNRVFDFFENQPGGVGATIMVWNSIGHTISASIASTAFLNNTTNSTVYFSNCTGVATGSGSAFYNERSEANTICRNCLGLSASGSAFLVAAASTVFDCEACVSNDGTATSASVVLDPPANWSDEAFDFVDEPNGDFHLAASDGGARGRGLNLSDDPTLSFNDDIDGDPRPAPPTAWSIGADE